MNMALVPILTSHSVRFSRNGICVMTGDWVGGKLLVGDCGLAGKRNATTT